MTITFLGWNKGQWMGVAMWLLLILVGFSRNVEQTLAIAFFTLPLSYLGLYVFARTPDEERHKNMINHARLVVYDEILALKKEIRELKAEIE